MNPSNKIQLTPSDESHGQVPIIETAQLVLDVYDTATPATRHLILSQLIGQAYETAPQAVRIIMIEHLLRPLGVLSVASAAKSASSESRLHNESRDPLAATREAQDIRASDVATLVDRAEHVNVEVVDAIAKMIKASPVMAGSAVAAILEKIPLRRTSSHRAGDPVCRRDSIEGRKYRIYDSLTAPQIPSSLNDSNRDT